MAYWFGKPREGYEGSASSYLEYLSGDPTNTGGEPPYLKRTSSDKKMPPMPEPKPTPGPEGGTQCPEGTGKAYEGCPCGDIYGSKTGSCPSGYVFIKREPGDFKGKGVTYQEGMIGTCQCQKAIQDWKAKNQGKLGEYKWPKELMDLYGGLMGRAGELLNRKPGYSDSILNLMFGKNFEKIRGQEAGTREQVLGNLGSQGMLGTGTALDALNKTAWNTEQNVGGVRRDIATLQADRELNDLLQQTDMAQKLFGTGAGFNQVLEAINSGRRGESQDYLAMMMQWIMSLMSSWAA